MVWITKKYVSFIKNIDFQRGNNQIKSQHQNLKYDATIGDNVFAFIQYTIFYIPTSNVTGQ